MFSLRILLIARSIVHRPQILFLDEPTTGLDPHARLDVDVLAHVFVVIGVRRHEVTGKLDRTDPSFEKVDAERDHVTR